MTLVVIKCIICRAYGQGTEEFNVATVSTPKVVFKAHVCDACLERVVSLQKSQQVVSL